MATLTLDTHAFIERLTKAGMTAGQARAVVEGLREADLRGVAAKDDLIALREDVIRLEGRLMEKVESVKTDLIKWLVPILLGQAGLIVALVRLL